MDATKDFSRKTIAALKKNGVAIVGATFVPGVDGTYSNGERAYQLSNGQLKTFLQVLTLAQ